ncbi:hypothetical protein ACHQM5_027150 [Ranunculus cassubicifolius]
MAAFQREAMAVMVIFMAFMAGLEVSEAKTYTVGDTTGWTTLVPYNYTQWSSTKTFIVGDVVVFRYNKAFHNVMQVSHEAFNDCNTSSPMAIYTTGDDSVTIKKNGHYYYLCGVPGHCQAGQKVDIRVVGKGSNTLPPTGAAMPPSTTGSEPSEQGPTAPGSSAPGPSAANSAIALPFSGALGFAALAVAIFAGFVTF